MIQISKATLFCGRTAGDPFTTAALLSSWLSFYNVAYVFLKMIPGLKPLTLTKAGHPGEKCRPDNNCHWFFWARSIMSDSSDAFRRQWQSRAGPLRPLCTTSIWWIKTWANQKVLRAIVQSGHSQTKANLSVPELLSQQEFFDISHRLCRTIFLLVYRLDAAL